MSRTFSLVIWLVVSVLVLTGCQSEPEPVWEGRKLSEWVDQLYDEDEDQQIEAIEAIENMGDQAQGVDLHLMKLANGHLRGRRVPARVRERAALALEARDFTGESLINGLRSDLEGDSSFEAQQDRKLLDNIEKVDPLKRKDFRSLDEN